MNFWCETRTQSDTSIRELECLDDDMSIVTKREWLYDQFDVSQPATDESLSESEDDSSTSGCESIYTSSEVGDEP